MTQTINLEDSLLNAYVDDELALAERQLVEDAIREDAEVASRIEVLRANDDLLRDALRPALEMPAPALVPAFPDGNAPDGDTVGPPSEHWLDWLRSMTGLDSLTPVAVGFASGVLGTLLVAGAVLLPGAPGDKLADAGRGTNSPATPGGDSEALRAQSLEHALETEVSGTAVSWRNPDRAEHGEVVPVRTYKSSAGRYCRDFTEVITRGGETVKERGVACREDTGTWRVRIRYYP